MKLFQTLDITTEKHFSGLYVVTASMPAGTDTVKVPSTGRGKEMCLNNI